MKKVLLTFSVLLVSCNEKEIAEKAKQTELQYYRSHKPEYLYTLDGCKVYTTTLYDLSKPQIIVTCPCNCKKQSYDSSTTH